jgi:hypothetical protein
VWVPATGAGVLGFVLLRQKSFTNLSAGFTPMNCSLKPFISKWQSRKYVYNNIKDIPVQKETHDRI